MDREGGPMNGEIFPAGWHGVQRRVAWIREHIIAPRGITKAFTIQEQELVRVRGLLAHVPQLAHDPASGNERIAKEMIPVFRRVFRTQRREAAISLYQM
jgi:hypothetical protein